MVIIGTQPVYTINHAYFVLTLIHPWTELTHRFGLTSLWIQAKYGINTSPLVMDIRTFSKSVRYQYCSNQENQLHTCKSATTLILHKKIVRHIISILTSIGNFFSTNGIYVFQQNDSISSHMANTSETLSITLNPHCIVNFFSINSQYVQVVSCEVLRLQYIFNNPVS